MDYRKLIDFANYMMVAYNEAMENMGLNRDLVLIQMASAFQEKAKHIVEKDFQLDIEGNDIKSVLESFINKIKETGICQRSEIVEFNDGNAVIKFGDCILNQATKILMKGRPDGYIPACPIISMLHGYIESITKKRFMIEKFEFIPNENTDMITIKMED
ncbi:MAG: hypothetical protein ACTSRP_11605 [Candidatus Helarchaeota archaeon]